MPATLEEATPWGRIILSITWYFLYLFGSLSSWVSGSNETKTYGKDATRREHQENPTLPRKSFFGKDTEERFCLFKDLRTLHAPIEPPFSGKLSSMTITSWRGAPRKGQIPWHIWLPASI